MSLHFGMFSINVQLNMSERKNGQLSLPKRAVRSRISSDVWQQVKTAYASGIGLREIARNMKIPEGTVLARAQREGWTRQIQNAKALAKREAASPVVTPMEAVAGTMRQRGERHTGRVAGITERMLMTFEKLSEAEQLRFVDELEKIDKIGRRTFQLDDAPPRLGLCLNVLNVDGSMFASEEEREAYRNAHRTVAEC
jgi:hypothetical protein